MVGRPSFVFTRKAVVGKTKFRSSPNNCNSVVGTNAKQLFSMRLIEIRYNFFDRFCDFNSL